MDTVIYLYNGQVQIVTGSAGTKPNLKGYFMIDAPEGSIINGMVMDTQLFVDFLKTTWTERHLSNKDVILVLNTSKFIGRNIELPKLNDKKSIEYIRREYSDLGRDNESIFGYISINENKNTRKVYSECIDPNFIKDYVSIFTEAGIKLKAIYSSESSLIGFTKRTSALNHRTFDLIIADANTLTTILFIDGVYTYYNTVRCFQEMGSREYADDIAKAVSSMVQFLRANQSDKTLDTIIIAGINADDINMYRNSIELAGFQIPVQAFTFPNNTWREASVQRYLPAISGLYPHDKSQNFLLQISGKNVKKESEGSKNLVKNLTIIGIVFLLMLLITVGSVVIKNIKQKELDALLEVNESPARMMDLALYDEYSSKNSYLRKQYDATADIEANIATYPLGDDNVLSVFNRCAKEGKASFDYSSFDAVNGEISIVAKAADVENINSFIKLLLNEEMFTSVNYTGYNYSDETELWNINVTCVLAESAGRPAKKSEEEGKR